MSDIPQMALWCGWCKAVIREGTLPATHGICRVCQAKLDEQILKRAQSGDTVNRDHEH